MMKPTRSWTTGLGLKTLATLLLSTLLISCGASKKYQEFIPSRILSVGDAMSYMSFDGSGAAVNNLTAVDPAATPPQTAHWLWTYANGYGLTSMGKPDTVGANVVFYNNNAAYLTEPTSQDASRLSLGTYAKVEAQVNQMFVSTPPRTGDLVILSVGMGDIFQLADTIGSTPVDPKNTSDINRQAATAIGLKYANLADNIYQRGYKHVLLVPAFDFSTSPYVATQSATYKSNIYALTEALNIGLMVNCNGGCTSSIDSKPYASRAEGVWKFDSYNYVLNISLNNIGSIQFNVTTRACPLTTPPTQTCSPTTLYDTSSPPLPFYYAGDLFATPTLHRLIGSYLYNNSRGLLGF